jgi:dihydrofolate synthase/folylpolyglutamate synthase
MTYEETINYLYTRLPLYQKEGTKAYKPGLQNIEALDALCNSPHKRFKTIHVAGSNGKGSVSHTLAAILQSAGYKTGLYTSPHLTDFRERIRVNGNKIPQDYVIKFTENLKEEAEKISPSFFEWVTELAFSYFASENVDIAVIETGLGGRLDSTNIISPILSVITNISLEHTYLLGDTYQAIATEKAGIIKENIPVVIGEWDDRYANVFIEKAKNENSKIEFAEKSIKLKGYEYLDEGKLILNFDKYNNLIFALGGIYQLKNAATILQSVIYLQEQGYNITEENIREGFAQVTTLTGLRGRWEILKTSPKVICDTGHNVGGITYTAKQISEQSKNTLHIVFGMVNDKDTEGVISLLPKNAKYYFTQPSGQRAMNAEEFETIATKFNLKGEIFKTVPEAYNKALSCASPSDTIYVGGSTFVVADLLEYLEG